MTYKGRPIASVRTPRSGLSYSAIYEWREAARWYGYRDYRDFEALPGDEQSRIVAHYRTHHQIQAVLAKAQTDDIRRKGKFNKQGVGKAKG